MQCHSSSTHLFAWFWQCCFQMSIKCALVNCIFLGVWFDLHILFKINGFLFNFDGVLREACFFLLFICSIKHFYLNLNYENNYLCWLVSLLVEVNLCMENNDLFSLCLYEWQETRTRAANVRSHSFRKFTVNCMTLTARIFVTSRHSQPRFFTWHTKI